MCTALNKLFQQIFNNYQLKKNCNNKKLESLTPYEIEIMPLILKELDDLDPHFYQMVIFFC